MILMLRPLLTAALGVVLAVSGLTGCDNGRVHARTVVAAFYPLAWVTEQVAGRGFTVRDLTSPGAEPHDLELSIRQTADVAFAGLTVFEHGFQPSVDRTVARRARGAVLDATTVVHLRPFAGSDEPDPHFWQDPLRMAALGDAVARELGRLDPAAAATYADNAAALRGRLTALDRAYARGLAGCERDTIVVSHDAFGYLEKFGVHVESVLGLSPDAEPTAATLADLRDLIRREGITTVFGETLASPQVAQALAREAGVRTAVLDPIEGLTEQTSDEDYLSLMRANLRALEEANGC
jgi:zinc transport system substrate-binding protein